MAYWQRTRLLLGPYRRRIVRVLRLRFPIPVASARIKSITVKLLSAVLLVCVCACPEPVSAKSGFGWCHQETSEAFSSLLSWVWLLAHRQLRELRFEL